MDPDGFMPSSNKKGSRATAKDYQSGKRAELGGLVCWKKNLSYQHSENLDRKEQKGRRRQAIINHSIMCSGDKAQVVKTQSDPTNGSGWPKRGKHGETKMLTSGSELFERAWY